MQRAFDVSAAYLNLTVFVFFAFCAVGVVLAGPVSDRFGRRPVLVAGCGPVSYTHLTFTWNTVPFLILPPLKEARVREVAVVRLTSVTAAPSLPGAVRESS